MHRFTGLAQSVALHIPWDRVDDFAALRRYAEDLGIKLGTINSNTFQDDDYKLGALTHTDKRDRQKAIDHHLACIDRMDDLIVAFDALMAERSVTLAAARVGVKQPALWWVGARTNGAIPAPRTRSR